MEYDIRVILNNFASLMGIPVRLYEEGKQTYFSSVVTLIKDPFLLDEKEVLNKTEPIGYYLDNQEFYYCYLNYESLQVVIGPTRTVPSERATLKRLAISLDIPLCQMDEFLSGMSLLVTMPYRSVLKSLSMLYYILSKKQINTDDFFLAEKEANERIKMGQESDFETAHNSYQIEKKMIALVREGDTDGFNAFIKSLPSFSPGVLSLSELRQQQNLFIVSATILSRAAIESGVDINEALSLTDHYIRQSESMTGENELSQLSYQMAYRFVREVKEVKSSTPLAYQVKLYVLHHLDESVVLTAISEKLDISVSQLCHRYKKETGHSVHEDIQRIKIEKSKELLLENIPFSHIAYYLGFSSQSHYTNTFKKITGITPLSFKKEAAEKGKKL